VSQPPIDLQFSPCEESAHLAKRFGLILKEDKGAFVLLFEKDKANRLLAELKIKENLKISFILKSGNPYFINFTEVPLEEENTIFYFSNTKSIIKENKQYLRETEKVSEQYPTKLCRTVKITPEEKNKSIEIKDVSGFTVYRSIVGDNGLCVDNQCIPIGKYQLFIDEKLRDEFVLYSNIPVRKPVAVVDIFLTGKLKEQLIKAVKGQETSFIDYSINFAARKTYWRYFLVSKYNTGLATTTIKGFKHNLNKETQQNVKFDGPEKVRLISGQDAFQFVSEKPLEIKQRSDYTFQLKSTQQGVSNGKTILEKLPLASAEMIKPETSNKALKVFSEIIVFI